MPATCFDGPPRGAGVSAAALRPELAAALRGVVRYGARPSVSRRLVCTGGLKMHAQACRTAPGAGVWLRLLEPRQLASILHAASTTRAQPQAQQGLTGSQIAQVVHSHPKNQRHNRSASMAPVRMSAGSETS